MPTPPASRRFSHGKPHLVVVHPPGGLRDYPFSISGYRKSYYDFMKLATTSFRVFYIRGKKNHLGQGIFKKGYEFKKNRLYLYKNKIYGRVLYNKTRLRANGGEDWAIVNKELLYKVTQNKHRTYQLFSRYMKPTYRVRNKQEFQKKLKKVTTDWVVFKPVRGAEGKGISIGPKKTFLQRMEQKKANIQRHSGQKNKYDGLLQEFIDTSDGIPGLHDTFHDMRILIMNGQIVQTYIRTPKKGSYLANVAQGGSMKEVWKKQIPNQAKYIALKIDKQFKKYGARIYAVDFGFEQGTPYLIEINPQPGLPYPSWTMYYRAWHRSLLKTLLSALP